MKNIKIVLGIALIALGFTSCKDEKQEKHDHSGLDPHIWLDPIAVKIQAKNIYEAMIKIDSVNSEFYKSN